MSSIDKVVCCFCKNEITNENQNVIPMHDEFVWIIGTFHHESKDQRKNTIICKISDYKYESGYFWHLFDKNISQQLENHYQENSHDSINFRVGTYNNILNKDFVVEKNLSYQNVHICIQEKNRSFCPIIRMKWNDAKNNLLVIGMNDVSFFHDIYVYFNHHDQKYYFFDMENQSKINNAFYAKQNKNIIINNKNYSFDANTKTISNESSSYVVEVFKYQYVST